MKRSITIQRSRCSYRFQRKKNDHIFHVSLCLKEKKIDMFAILLKRMMMIMMVFVIPTTVSQSSVRTKVVINTPWWPPGTENTSESVGILSYGDVYCTGMMENNNSTLSSELSDVTDILVGANVTEKELVQCLINAPKNRSSEVKERLETLLSNVTLVRLYCFFSKDPDSTHTHTHTSGNFLYRNERGIRWIFSRTNDMHRNVRFE